MATFDVCVCVCVCVSVYFFTMEFFSLTFGFLKKNFYFLLLFKKILISLAIPDLSCCMWDF